MISLAKHLLEHLDMPREGGQVLFHRLAVADVCEHGNEDIDTRALACGQRKARPDEEGCEPQGLQGDGLAPGVGSGDHEASGLAVDPEVVGHHVDTAQLEHGVAGLDQANDPATAYGRKHATQLFAAVLAPPSLGSG